MMVHIPLISSYYQLRHTQTFSDHKRQQTLLLQIYCIDAEQRYSTGSFKTACQSKEVLEGLTQDRTCLWPPRWWGVNYQHAGWLIGKGRCTTHLAGWSSWPVSDTHPSESIGKQRLQILGLENNQLLHFAYQRKMGSWISPIEDSFILGANQMCHQWRA